MRLIKIIFCGALLASAACSKNSGSGNGNTGFGGKLEMPPSKPISDEDYNTALPLFKSSIEILNALSGTSSSPNLSASTPAEQVISENCAMTQVHSQNGSTVDVVSTLTDLPPHTCPVSHRSHTHGIGAQSETIVSFSGSIENETVVKDPSAFIDLLFLGRKDSGRALVRIERQSQQSGRVQGRIEVEGVVQFKDQPPIKFIVKNDSDLVLSSNSDGATTVNGKVSAAYGAQLSFGWVILRIEGVLTNSTASVKCTINDRDFSSDTLCTSTGQGSLMASKILSDFDPKHLKSLR